MSRLDHHVAFVQNKLAVSKFLDALSRTVAILGGAIILAILVDRLLWISLPRAEIWLWAAVAVAALIALMIAVMRRPTAQEAAVRIDQALNTNDKFATALHVRTLADPFAQAALLDAEQTAQAARLDKRFPLVFPKFAYITFALALIAIGMYLWMGHYDLFGKEQKQRQLEARARVVEQSKTQLRNALATVNAVPKALQEDPAIKLAKESVVAQLAQPNIDPERAQRTAAKALQNLDEAIKQQIKTNDKFVQAENDAKMLKQLQSPGEEKGPVADIHREIAKGNFSDAVSDLNKVVEKFDKMDEKEQEKAAEQMKKMAANLQQMANNPQAQQQMQQQLEKMGMDKQQAQAIQQQMQKAAQGDKQAQQQLQQMAQQAMQQMNPQQKQAAQQAMQQMQAQANGQQQAQQMAQAAQQMAQAMKQQAQQGAQQKQGQQGQQAQKNGQQQGQQAQGQKGQQQQQGQQPGQQQGMGQAMQQMQAQMQQMQAAQQDAEQIAAAQQAAQQGAQQAMDGMNGNQPGKGGGQQNDWNANQGQNGQGGGNPNQPWNGQGNNQQGPNNGGQGAGDRGGKTQAPYGVKKEISPSFDDDKGKILASTLVKASAIKGESKEQLKEVADNAKKDAAEEVDQDRVSRQAQNVVRDYFGSMQKDADGSAAPSEPATQPSN